MLVSQPATTRRETPALDFVCTVLAMTLLRFARSNDTTDAVEVRVDGVLNLGMRRGCRRPRTIRCLPLKGWEFRRLSRRHDAVLLRYSVHPFQKIVTVTPVKACCFAGRAARCVWREV